MVDWTRFFSLHEERWQRLDEALTNAFDKVKRDTHHLHGWITYFKHKDAVNHNEHKILREMLVEQQKEIEGLNEELHILREKLSKLDELDEKIRNVVEKQVRTRSGLSTDLVRTEPEKPIIKTKRIFEKHITERLKPHQKDYLLAQIIKLVEKGEYSTTELERIIVKEKALCGRTAFYTYLKELRDRGFIKEEKGVFKRALKTEMPSTDIVRTKYGVRDEF